MEKITICRIVEYVLPDGQNRPAIVVREGVEDFDDGATGPMVNLQVFLDGENDASVAHHERQYGSAWRTSVKFDADQRLGTWHWPKRMEKK